MSTRTLLSIEEFMRTPEDGQKHELHEGELVVMPPPRHRHTVIALRVYDALRDYLRTHPLGSVYHEAGARLTAEEPRQTVLQPDVSYYRQNRDETIPPDGYAGVPDLVAEVISPSEHAARQDRKKNYYLGAAVECIWLIFPVSREVQVFREGKVIRLTESSGDVLTDPTLFPGWAGIRLAELFQ